MAEAQEVRQAILEMSSDAAQHRKTKGDLLHLRFVRTARKNWGKFAMADSTGREVTYGEALIGSVLLANWLKESRPVDEKIGLLLPTSVGGALANVGAMLAGKIPVNLNFTAGPEAMGSAIDQCAMKTVITSKAFLAKAKIEAPEGSVYLEDILGAQTGFDKARAAATARLMPARLLVRRYRRGVTPDSLATIIFSSGSTGVPKGVMLSHYNILSNIESMEQLFWLGRHDCIAGVLPFFHSFGFTVTIWLPLITGCRAVYHPNPTDAKAIGALVEKYQGTFLLSTPTFCASYSRHCTREQFASLRFVLVGAEKLREPVAVAFHETFDLDLLEGYGCTEMSPVVAVNSPNFEAGRDTQTGNKSGTVGHPVPGVAVKVVDPNTFETLAPNVEGLLLVKGPNRMLGYLNQPERTTEVLHEGWYTTGDIALIDDEGFVRITDRLSRFSKIGGEMVPHLKVEDALCSTMPDCRCAVAGIPDANRGERLVLLYTNTSAKPAEIWQALAKTDLPRLWVPKQENIYPVEALPTLGTGKLDLRGVKSMAAALAESLRVSPQSV
jgi:acyl-[acyl-carrier-protein]-phospholipid O-acyltransferase/long-chain-fatty-acid--[acyl-carrier-protein] ligase